MGGYTTTTTLSTLDTRARNRGLLHVPVPVYVEILMDLQVRPLKKSAVLETAVFK